MIKAGIIGSTGYAGGELVRILTGHKEAEIKWYGSRSYIDQNYADVYRNLFQIVDAKCMDDNMDALADQVDVIFTATPQGLCASLINEEILSKTKVIDLSADFRIKDVSVYEEWYKIEHKSPQFIEEAVYGLRTLSVSRPKPLSSALLLHTLRFPLSTRHLCKLRGAFCLPLRRLSFSLRPHTLRTLRRRNYRPAYTAFLYSGCVCIPHSLPASLSSLCSW